MSGRAASHEDLLPRPRRARCLPGVCRLHNETRILFDGSDDDAAAAAARLLRALPDRNESRTRPVRTSLGRAPATAPPGSLSPRGAPELGAVVIERIDRADRGDQWYSLRIRPTGIRLRAAGAAGLRFGVQTLGQLAATACGSIRAMEIEDWPDFPVRGVMLDVSRGKVPTLATLEHLIDLLAGWKINHLQLYTEHTFAYAGHERVWRGASPLTGRQIERLDRTCRDRGIELVPNQNSFGHMERWLRHPPYAALAETRGRWKTPFGEYRTSPATLCPQDPRSIRLVASLYDQLLPHFSSRLCNVGCDETWELGQGRSRAACRRRGVGRVYLEFLLKLHRALRRHGRRMMFWADIAQQHPALITDLPGDVIPLVWGYEADHAFDLECRRLATHGLDFYVCPGTSSWSSFGGRTRNCLANLRRAAASGRRHGAAGYLITDWGDQGHRQYLPVSYCGFLYGAAVSWCARTNASIDVARELGRHAFVDLTGMTGRLWCDAGTIHEPCGVIPKNRTVLFACMQTPMKNAAAISGLTVHTARHMASRAADLQTVAARTRFGGMDGDLVRLELLATLAVLHHACRRAETMLAHDTGRGLRRRRRALGAEMTRIIETHRALWLARNRRGGLASSLAHYRENLREYKWSDT